MKHRSYGWRTLDIGLVDSVKFEISGQWAYNGHDLYGT